MRLAALIVLFAAFTSYSLFVASSDGVFGVLTLAMREKWAMQMLLDLTISLVIAWTWLGHDAKSRGINPVPYQLLTVLLGSIAVLVYLIRRELKKKAPAAG